MPPHVWIRTHLEKTVHYKWVALIHTCGNIVSQTAAQGANDQLSKAVIYGTCVVHMVNPLGGASGSQ